MCDARHYPLSFAEGDQVKRWSRSMWRLRPKGRRERISVDITHPPGIARFGSGLRSNWFKSWLHMTAQDYSGRFDPSPNTTADEYFSR